MYVEVSPVNDDENLLKHASWLGANWRKDADQTIQVLRNLKPDWLVVDHYAIDAKWERKVKVATGVKIMAIDGILACFQQPDRWFTGVVVTDGAGSPRDDLYANYTDEQMRAIRVVEQKKAAIVGEYAAQALLDYPSAIVKNSAQKDPVEDLQSLLRLACPEVVYTHNLADKHPTHVAVALRAIEAIRGLPEAEHPGRLLGCEVWRDLGWMLDEDKVVFDTTAHESLQAALLGVFDSQIAGGKRYDFATMGRRKANATYFASHAVDVMQGMATGMDLTPLIQDASLDVQEYVQSFIRRFAEDVERIIASVG